MVEVLSIVLTLFNLLWIWHMYRSMLSMSIHDIVCPFHLMLLVVQVITMEEGGNIITEMVGMVGVVLVAEVEAVVEAVASVGEGEAMVVEEICSRSQVVTMTTVIRKCPSKAEVNSCIND